MITMIKLSDYSCGYVVFCILLSQNYILLIIYEVLKEFYFYFPRNNPLNLVTVSKNQSKNAYNAWVWFLEQAWLLSAFSKGSICFLC